MALAFAGAFCTPFWACAGDYQLLLGASRSWPNLHESNRAIHSIEAEVRSLAPGAKVFEDWHDVYTGSVAIGVARKVCIYGVTLWPNLSLAWARGDVETSQSGLPTVYGVPLDYRFSQEYRLWAVETGVFWPVFARGPLVWSLAGYLSVNWLHSITSFNARALQMGYSRRGRGDFREMAPGVSIGTTLEYTFGRKVGALVSAKYQWCRFEGETTVQDSTRLPTGAVDLKYDQDTLVDTSGFVLGIYLNFHF